jgi:hypothetical protein
MAAGLTLSAALAAAQVPGPTAEHEQLMTFVGDWTATGMSFGAAIRGEFHCERFPGGYHVVCRGLYDLTKEGKTEVYHGLDVFGYSPEEKVYVWQGANSQGWTPLGSVRGQREPNGWTWTRETREGGRKVFYRWAIVESKDTFTIKATAAREGGAPEVMIDSVYTRSVAR